MSVGRTEVGEVDYQVLQAQQNMSYDDIDADFWDLFSHTRMYSMTSVEASFDLYKSIEYIHRAKIPGGILEAGVWMGGSMMLAAYLLQRLGDVDRTLYLYDTFTGTPEPQAEDIDITGNPVINRWQEGQAMGGLDEVRRHMGGTKYPPEKIELVVGKVEDVIPQIEEPFQLALVRIDVNLVQPSKIALEAFWPMLAPSGVLILDDYGHFPNVKKMVDEYFQDKPVKINRIDYSCRSIVKPGAAHG